MGKLSVPKLTYYARKGWYVYLLNGKPLLMHAGDPLNYCIRTIKEIRTRYSYGLRECKDAWDLRTQLVVPCSLRRWWIERNVTILFPPNRGYYDTELERTKEVNRLLVSACRWAECLLDDPTSCSKSAREVLDLISCALVAAQNRMDGSV